MFSILIQASGHTTEKSTLGTMSDSKAYGWARRTCRNGYEGTVVKLYEADFRRVDAAGLTPVLVVKNVNGKAKRLDLTPEAANEFVEPSNAVQKPSPQTISTEDALPPSRSSSMVGLAKVIFLAIIIVAIVVHFLK